MNRARLESLLARFPALAVLVIGDFFLDKYLVIDRRLAEISLETGLEAHQVVEVRCSPGGAGTVTANLRALGANILALGSVGDDGEGYELKRALRAIGVDISLLIERPDRFTPTYTKPMLRGASPPADLHELNWLDIKNRAPLPTEVEDTIISHFHKALPRVHGVVTTDQVTEANCGVITDRVRVELCAQARAHPDKVIAADSRERIRLFQNVILKSNAREAVRAVHPKGNASDPKVVETCGAALAGRAGRPVFVTMGADGILLCDESGCTPIPTVPAEGPIDPVGAGDSVMAGLASALCAGASSCEAAIVGNLVAGVTAAVETLKTILVGEDPMDVERLWTKMMYGRLDVGPHRVREMAGQDIYDRYGTSAPGLVAGTTVAAISGLEIALLDLVGKALKTPVYQLLGGKFRDRIRVYADSHAGEVHGLDAWRRRAAEVRARLRRYQVRPGRHALHSLRRAQRLEPGRHPGLGPCVCRHPDFSGAGISLARRRLVG